MKKILLSHTHFDMKPFYEWEDLEMMPLAVSWLDRSGFLEELEEGMQLRAEVGKLFCIYQFTQVFPLMFVPGN